MRTNDGAGVAFGIGRVVTGLVLAALLSQAPQAVAAGGVPMGAEFQINTFTTSRQKFPSVSSDAAGNFVVVWSSYTQDAFHYGVFGQRYAASGAVVGGEFQVNSVGGGNQNYPSVASDSAGNFVVVWQDSGQSGGPGTYKVFGRRYSSSGSTVGPEFQVNTYTTNHTIHPSVASDSSGNFVVVWQTRSQEGDPLTYGIFGQRYGSSGAPLGLEFLVNTYTTDTQIHPAVASAANGDFVVVWQSRNQEGEPGEIGVFGQRYSSTGAQAGPEFIVNTFTSNSQRYPSVASDSAGNFIVVWQSRGQEGQAGTEGIYGRRFSSAGTPFGSEFLVNAWTTGNQTAPRAASDPGGSFVAVFDSFGLDGASRGVFGQRYASSGALLGGEFQVNTYTTDSQRYPAVSASNGSFVVVWSSFNQVSGTSNYDVFGQRYGAILPVELLRFTAE